MELLYSLVSPYKAEPPVAQEEGKAQERQIEGIPQQSEQKSYGILNFFKSFVAPEPEAVKEAKPQAQAAAPVKSHYYDHALKTWIIDGKPA